jgi:hypothetical protein
VPSCTIGSSCPVRALICDDDDLLLYSIDQVEEEVGKMRDGREKCWRLTRFGLGFLR